MTNLVTGILLLLGLVALQAGLRYWTALRTRAAWEGAQADLARGDFTSAEAGIARCVKLMPLWLQPRFLLGAVLAKQGKLEAAEEQFKMACALQPRDPKGHIELGVFYLTAAMREDEGLAALNEALRHDPGAYQSIAADPRLLDFQRSDAFERLVVPAASET